MSKFKQTIDSSGKLKIEFDGSGLQFGTVDASNATDARESIEALGKSDPIELPRKIVLGDYIRHEGQGAAIRNIGGSLGSGNAAPVFFWQKGENAPISSTLTLNRRYPIDFVNWKTINAIYCIFNNLNFSRIEIYRINAIGSNLAHASNTLLHTIYPEDIVIGALTSIRISPVNCSRVAVVPYGSPESVNDVDVGARFEFGFDSGEGDSSENILGETSDGSKLQNIPQLGNVNVYNNTQYAPVINRFMGNESAVLSAVAETNTRHHTNGNQTGTSGFPQYMISWDGESQLGLDSEEPTHSGNIATIAVFDFLEEKTFNKIKFIIEGSNSNFYALNFYGSNNYYDKLNNGMQVISENYFTWGRLGSFTSNQIYEVSFDSKQYRYLYVYIDQNNSARRFGFNVIQEDAPIGLMYPSLPEKMESNEISFDVVKTYNSYDSPATGDITHDLDGAKFGLTQKIYHNDSSEPTYPSEWVKISDKSYINDNLNIIVAEYIDDSRIEYFYR